jgi:hypothetical protein
MNKETNRKGPTASNGANLLRKGGGRASRRVILTEQQLAFCSAISATIRKTGDPYTIRLWKSGRPFGRYRTSLYDSPEWKRCLTGSGPALNGAI